MRKLLMILPLSLLAVACGGTGLGNASHADVAARMESVRDPLAACYGTALTKNRKLEGTIKVSFEAAPKTGQFSNVTVTQDEPNDPELTQCVVTTVSGLKLEKPTKTKLAVEYPIQFGWVD